MCFLWPKVKGNTKLIIKAVKGMVFGERLKQLREGKYTQEELAEKMNVHSVTISRWENGTQEPHSRRVSELAKILGTTPAYLLGDTDKPNVEESLPEIKPSENALVWERGGERIALPNTPETRTLFERLVLASMAGREAPQPAAV